MIPDSQMNLSFNACMYCNLALVYKGQGILDVKVRRNTGNQSGS